MARKSRSVWRVWLNRFAVALQPRARPHWGKRLLLEALEDRIVLSQDVWIAGTGNWNNGANWSLGFAPRTTDTALISTNSAATITIVSGDNIKLQALTTGANDALSFTGGDLTVTQGSSILSGALSMSGGYLEADGTTASLAANGTTTIADASLYSQGGATFSLPQLTS